MQKKNSVLSPHKRGFLYLKEIVLMEDKEEKIINFIEDFGCCKEEQKKNV